MLEWTKGFDIANVVGRDVVELMHAAFARKGIAAQIHAVCNDTVGTLLAAAYDHDNCRVGMILGTGCNGCYIESEGKEEEVVNVEWGNFDKLLPRMPPDFAMDQYTPNAGSQFAEKMISGHYLGELVRLLSIEVFRERITDYGESTSLNFKWRFEAETVSAVLARYYEEDIDGVLDIVRSDPCGLTSFTREDALIFAQICALIVNRSADLATTLLLGTLEKTGLFTCSREDDRNPFEEDVFELTAEYKQDTNRMLTVGIDGSVYQHVPRYKERMEMCMLNLVGKDIASRVVLVHSADGSGKGAALAVAASLGPLQKGKK